MPPHAVSDRQFDKWEGDILSDIPLREPVDEQKTPAAWLGCQDQAEFTGYVPDDKVEEYRHYHPQVQRLLARGRVQSGTENWL